MFHCGMVFFFLFLLPAVIIIAICICMSQIMQALLPA